MLSQKELLERLEQLEQEIRELKELISEGRKDKSAEATSLYGMR